jgi:hypothetical protein
MPESVARANAAKLTIRARIEHVFDHQKNRYGLFIRTIGMVRGQAKLTPTKRTLQTGSLAPIHAIRPIISAKSSFLRVSKW